MLYWRILKEHKEIEIVMVVNGTSYAAVGWRPRSLTSTCKNFPQIGPVIKAIEPTSSPEPESEPEPTSEPEPQTEPTSEPSISPKKSIYNRRSAGVTSAQFEIPDGTVETSVSFQVSKKQGLFVFKRN